MIKCKVKQTQIQRPGKERGRRGGGGQLGKLGKATGGGQGKEEGKSTNNMESDLGEKRNDDKEWEAKHTATKIKEDCWGR